MKNIQSQMPQAICEIPSGDSANYHLLVNYHTPPFDNPQLRQAMTLALDRKAFVDIMTEGQGQTGGVLQPPPAGLWGMTPEQFQAMPGYGADVESSRAQARQIMQRLGYGPDKRLNIKVTTRNLKDYRDPAVLLIDQLRQAYIDGELELIEAPQWFPKILRKDYTVALNSQISGPDPDRVLKAYYGCAASLNWDGYCNPEVDKLIEVQSQEADPARRKNVLLQIERTLMADNARPILFYTRRATCRQPYVKGLTIMANSLYNGWRMEDVWLDK
jgi:peptide/nickel transport system substrate-binding protein